MVLKASHSETVTKSFRERVQSDLKSAQNQTWLRNPITSFHRRYYHFRFNRAFVRTLALRLISRSHLSATNQHPRSFKTIPLSSTQLLVIILINKYNISFTRFDVLDPIFASHFSFPLSSYFLRTALYSYQFYLAIHPLRGK